MGVAGRSHGSGFSKSWVAATDGGAGNRERREEILTAALQELTACGYQGASTLAIARRARTSKETLYNWFGSKQGLFAAVVEWAAESMYLELPRPADAPDLTMEVALRRLARDMVQLASGDRWVTLMRIGVSEALESPEFGQCLLAIRRRMAQLILGDYFETQRAAGRLVFETTQAACDAFAGLTLGDIPIKMLLGASRPAAAEVEERATRAVEQFIRLYAPAGCDAATPAIEAEAPLVK